MAGVRAKQLNNLMNRLFESVFHRSPKGTGGTVPQPNADATVHAPVSPLQEINEERIAALMELPRAQRLAEFTKIEVEFRNQVATARKELASSLRTLDTAEAEFKKFRRIVRSQP